MISALCRLLLRLAGWRVVFAPIPVAKAVVVVYPHTSNLDFILGMLFRFASRLPLRYAAKDTLFRGPTGALFRALGGVPVNRRQRTGFVAQMVAEFARHDVFYLAITPEGTRRAVPWLKSGFYRLALAAQVPLALGVIDYGRKEVGIAGYMTPTGDETADLARMAAAYAGRRGRHPAQHGPFVFKDNAPE